MSQWPALEQIAKQVQNGKSSALSLVDRALKTISTKESYHAVIATTAERARQRAKVIDQKVKKGRPAGRLAGVPFIAKDNFLAFGAETTAASNILRGFKAPYQATAIDRLEAEGAILVAKSNLDAFAHGSSTENSDFFVTLNPHDKTRVPGGSSGGSAAGVILEMAPFALGTDTGGSIRLPAAFCGVVGLKPTYGLVSRSGVVAMASSLDVIGPLARTVDDAALVLDIMAGRDELDSTTIERDARPYTDLRVNPSGLKIGVIEEYMDDNVDKAVRANIEAAINALKRAGARVFNISIPSMPLSLAAYYILCPAEVSSNLSRYDGQHFGYSNQDTKTLDESYQKTRSIGFGKEAKRRIMIGTYVLSSGYYDAYYKQAQIVRTKLLQEFEHAFSKVDFLAGPVSPTLPFKIGEKTKDPLKMYLSDVMMVGANLVGIPAISVPVGMSDGLPVGLQLLAPQKQDRQLLGLAMATSELMT